MKETYTIKRKKNCFSMIDNALIETPNLSWQAKGLLIYLISRPDGWKIYKADIAKRATNGANSINTIFKELRKKGYMVLNKIVNKQGQCVEWNYEIYEEPLSEPVEGVNTIKPESEKHHVENQHGGYPQSGFPEVDKPQVGNPQVEIPPTNNTKDNNIDDKYIISQSEYEELTDGQTQNFINIVNIVLETAQTENLKGITPQTITDFFDYWESVPKGKIHNMENYMKETICNYFKYRL